LRATSASDSQEGKPPGQTVAPDLGPWGSLAPATSGRSFGWAEPGPGGAGGSFGFRGVYKKRALSVRQRDAGSQLAAQMGGDGLFFKEEKNNVKKKKDQKGGLGKKKRATLK